ncbi:hypothetical protein [Puerhibacterium puerhi]|uniref:hypothetical protein n=1 Tax=Puerhibacterium puerhi TaxID=2692623 RepID=UPI00135AC9DA|nr:hypothetical protein [Puerhibacterium puerhi]
MIARTVRAAATGALLGALALAGCAETGHVDIWNGSEDDVTVRFGAEETRADLGRLEDITADGGVSITTRACYDGPFVVEHPDGRTVEVPGPLCPGQTLLVHDATAEVVGTQSAG